KKDNVISQSPKDEEIDEGSTIEFTVSKGAPKSDDDKEDEEKDADDKDKDDKEFKDDEPATKDYTETYEVQYTGKDDDSQEVKVFVR
ncbi:serine/threonine protein kinase, partial [Staphylococcus saprophyticus]